uniref:Chromosome-partitioning ATPase n=1 Tax=Aliivibrio fischeri TaxID=668 RepID=H2ES69_ALIFS|nr:ParA family protein [Aliivibrio fischeri]AEY78236.1 chromosome-partitioning ATPase [Aliivibrio fischeri]
MNSNELRERLEKLVNIAGSTRKAADVIKAKFGYGPTHSAIYKAIKGSNTSDFVVSCYIAALEEQQLGQKKMGKVVSVANQKGGVGKTTVLVNAGLHIASLGKKVLFLDIDPQNNLVISLAPDLAEHPDFKKGSHPAHNINMFEWEGNEPFMPIPYEISDNVHIIGTSKLSGNVTQNSIYNLADSLDLIKDRYDYIFIDSPPSAGTLQHAALSIADALIIVSQPQKLSVKGVDDLMMTVRQVQRRMNPDLKLLGIVINQVKRPPSKTQTVHVNLLREQYGNLVFNENLYDTVRVTESMAQGMSMQEFSAKAAQDFGFSGFYDEFISRLEKEVHNG